MALSSAQWGPLRSGPGAPGILEREDRRKQAVCEERVVTMEPNQEITAQAERVWPRWCLTLGSHTAEPLGGLAVYSGCAEQTQAAEQAGLGQPLWRGNRRYPLVTEDTLWS